MRWVEWSLGERRRLGGGGGKLGGWVSGRGERARTVCVHDQGVLGVVGEDVGNDLWGRGWVGGWEGKGRQSHGRAQEGIGVYTQTDGGGDCSYPPTPHPLHPPTLQKAWGKRPLSIFLMALCTSDLVEDTPRPAYRSDDSSAILFCPLLCGQGKERVSGWVGGWVG